MAVDYDFLNRTVLRKFGITLTYTPAGKTARPIMAVVERAYESEVGGIGIQSESLVLQVVDDDLPELAAGDGFTYLGTAYKAVEIKPDFHGMSDVLLNKA